jgi:hypothetical protein
VPYDAHTIAWWAAGEIAEIVGALLRREPPGPEPEWYRRCRPVYERVAEVNGPVESSPDAD